MFFVFKQRAVSQAECRRFDPGLPLQPFQRSLTPNASAVHAKLKCSHAVESRACWKGTLIQMAKRRGNPNWGKPEPIGPVVPTITSFEQVVKEYKLTPDQYVRSTRLREWARRNKNSKYIPEALLEAWGFEIESTL
jgi:hypothetical protein